MSTNAAIARELDALRARRAAFTKAEEDLGTELMELESLEAILQDKRARLDDQAKTLRGEVKAIDKSRKDLVKRIADARKAEDARLREASEALENANDQAHEELNAIKAAIDELV